MPLPVGRHRTIMFADGSREMVAACAIALRDEKQVFRVDRIERGLERRSARIGDRTGRESGVLVGIVRVRILQIRLVNRPAITMLEERCVNGCRIAIEKHPDANPVPEDPRDSWPLAGYAGFFLD